MVQILMLAPFLRFISGFSGFMRYVVSDIPIDDEVSMVTSRISRLLVLPVLSLSEVLIWVNARECCECTHVVEFACHSRPSSNKTRKIPAGPAFFLSQDEANPIW
jgi:hypothetical protein